MTGFDYVVVGGGAAGCLLAARLSDDPACRVALIEAGLGHLSPLHTIPGLAPFAAKDGRHLWRVVTESENNLAGRQVTLLQGRVLGGSAAVNGMVYTRGHAADYDAWDCPGWTAADVLPWFRPPVATRPSRPQSPLPQRFLLAAEQSGFALTDDLNADVVDAFGLTHVTVANGMRANTRLALLRPAMAQPNLTVMTNTPVRRLAFSGTRACGVVVARDGREQVIAASREVILTAGGLRSPHLLMLSGIGPAAMLRAAGVTVLLDLPGVGRNLQNHPSFPLRYVTTEPVSLARQARPLAAVGAALSWLTRRQGVLAENIFNAAGFVRTDPSLAAPDAQIVMSPVLFPADAARGLALLPRRHGVTLAVQQGSPFSRGEVTLASADPLAPPRVRTGAFSDPRDVAVLGRAIRMARDIMAQPAMAGLRPELPEAEFDTPAALESSIRRLSGSAYHQSGTCRMGTDAEAVVDHALRVHGVEGLRVADGSIIPRLMNAALQAPTMMIAERAAAMITRRNAA
ncbi:GMC family oxidoreductase [Roseomonas elaeocarpi]|uniref:GMC family oxidoreductase n=1 Tax=Roseomonas elaeocarpi TaxID=907779 RepID=A0ABV6JNX5_9PROT